MPFSPSSNKRPSTPRQNYYGLLAMMAFFVVIGPLLIFQSMHAEHRDQPSLQWPKTSGKIMQCDEGQRSSRHGTHYYVTATYTYVVNDHRYVGHQIALWSEDFSTGSAKPLEFIAAHPVPSPVDVYYDPQNPANAVLVPGPDEAMNHQFIRSGSIAFIGSILLIFMVRPKLAEYKAQMEWQKNKALAQPKHLISTSKSSKNAVRESYVCYTPGSKPKLSICPDKNELSDMLGADDGQPICDWKPEDRIIDTAGREYRLAKQPGKGGYDLDPTGETWTYDRLLNLAEANRRLPKNDPNILRRKLDGIPESERMAVLMKSISDLPSRAGWYITGFLLFLLLFFIAIVFIAGKFFIWLSTR